MHHPPEAAGLRPPPARQFFMGWRDLGFWLRCARTDQLLGRLQREQSGIAGFEQLYDQRPDPWGAAVPGYRYQRLKYQRLLALIPQRRYEEALDLGCGIGAFTRQVAPFVGHVTGVELCQAGVAQARSLSRDHANVDYLQGDVRELTPAIGSHVYDLILLADVLYYLRPLTDGVLDAVCEAVVQHLAPGGVLLLANHSFGVWDPDSRRTSQIHRRFAVSRKLRVLRQEWRPFYRATLFERRDATSTVVAEAA